ncbi:hypothetical protein AAG570_005909 [Ranatra chinensis]|uniref:Short-chain dehydrogenase/reductase 3 n=1 Tax=Ranatra chinensis TaxID=642074 RepID=A0ABD0YI96_9HEMI
MLLKIYSITIILLDVFVLLAKCFYATFEGLYYLIFPPAEKSVAGEVVLITGTGHGIGRELAIQFAELGATVVCVDINSEGNDETIQMIKDKGLNRVYPYDCDVSNEEDVQDVVELITKEVGPVTVLVNNAGIMPCRHFMDYKPEEIQKIFQVNVFAHFWLLREILPSMIKNNYGHIVALSSMAGVIGLRNLVPYCSSKFAVRGMMEALAEELREECIGTDINFTCIFPYMVNTGLCKKPRVRFPGMLAMVSPKTAAKLIIQAVRRNTMAISIPNWYLVVHDIVR